MPGLSAPTSLGAGRGESWEDGRLDIRGDDEGSSEARKLKFAISVSCQPFEPTVSPWKY